MRVRGSLRPTPAPVSTPSADRRRPCRPTRVTPAKARSRRLDDRTAATRDESMEAAAGFEPAHNGFAVRSLNHLGTPPCSEKTDTYTTPLDAGAAVAVSCAEVVLKFCRSEALEDRRRTTEVSGERWA